MLELAERAHDRIAVHDRQKLGAGLTVAVLPRQRAAVARDHRRRLDHEPFELGDAVGRRQLEVDPAVDAALTEVSVQRRIVSVSVVERAQIAQIRADLVRWNGRIFPAGMEVAG